MSDKKMIRGFHWFSQAWYGKYQPERNPGFSIEIYAVEGGCEAEFQVKWVQLDKQSYAQLTLFSDSWKIIPKCKDLFDAMSKANEDITESDFYDLLISCGLQDLTNYTNPDVDPVVPFIDKLKLYCSDPKLQFGHCTSAKTGHGFYIQFPSKVFILTGKESDDELTKIIKDNLNA